MGTTAGAGAAGFMEAPGCAGSGAPGAPDGGPPGGGGPGSLGSAGDIDGGDSDGGDGSGPCDCDCCAQTAALVSNETKNEKILRFMTRSTRSNEVIENQIAFQYSLGTKRCFRHNRCDEKIFHPAFRS